MKSEVIIQFEMEGFHNYPEPPEQVEFLKYIHRHTFTIKCGYEVTDLNREKEIQFKNMSCEMIAKEILEFSKEDQMKWCEVWEEKTGGAKVEL